MQTGKILNESRFDGNKNSLVVVGVIYGDHPMRI